MATASNNREVTANRPEYLLTPAADIYETKDDYSMMLEMPGVTRENLTITIDNDELEIEGKVSDAAPEGKELKYSEYRLYDFYRKFRVGDDIDRNRIDATLENGVLKLVLHKVEAVKPKKIEVKIN